MGDVSTLLRDAVPVEQIEPDIDAVTRRVRSRRRRRIVARMTACLVVLLGVGVSAALAAGGRADDPRVEAAGDQAGTSPGSTDADSNTDAVVGADDDVDTLDLSGSADVPDATEFMRVLAARDWLQPNLFPSWPVQPGEFFAGAGHLPDAVIVGRLEEVRSGRTRTDICMYIRECISQSTTETVISIDRVLVGDVDPSVPLPVGWGRDFTGSGEVAQPESSPAAGSEEAILQDVAPIGGRVLVFLFRDAESGEWRPVEPSGIAIEDPQGVAIPQRDPYASDLPISFDDYVAGVEQALADQ